MAVRQIDIHGVSRRVRFGSLLLTVCGAMLIAGCGSGASTGTVAGTVTLDGQPLAAGTVNFVPKDGTSTTVAGQIKDGAFQVEAPVGLKQVMFSAPKPTGKTTKMYDTPDSPETEIVEELLPPRYNVTSELSWEVVRGRQEAKFELTSSSGPR